jgi:hypothetical protein
MGDRLSIPAGGGAGSTPYPGYDVAGGDKWALDWDEKTRDLVRDRVDNVPPFRFFSPDEVALLEAICARALPQEDRPAGQRVPIAPWIDDRLHRGEGSGTQYETMPADPVAYRLGLRAFDQSAQALFGRPFVDLAPHDQDAVVDGVGRGDPPGDLWQGLPARPFFTLLMADVISAYYAHPAAWAEIGFGGPASPRGHIRLGLGQRDPWEAEEIRPRSSVPIVRQAEPTGDGGGEATH